MTERTEAARRTRPPVWRDARVLRFAWQAVFVVVVVLVLREAFLNLDFGMRQRGRDLSFSFLQERAGFGIKEGIEYSPNASAWTAYIVGVANTLRVAVVGIILTTILGLVVGIARLSDSWLVRKIAQVYVETFRNTPVLLQIIFWWTAVILVLPAIGGGLSVGGVAFLSNLGAAISWPRLRAGAGGWGAFLLLAVVLAGLVWWWRTRVNERTGRPHRRFVLSTLTFLAVAVAGYLIVGDPVEMDVPTAERFGYEGGVQLSGEYSALLFGLVIYTSSFIAEIVRGSILSVPRGQKEAAEALGLTPGQQLRYVVLPQALRVAIPPINNQYLNLTKNTSLAIAIGFPDLVSVSTTIMNQKGRAPQMLLLMMATFLVMTLTISFLMNLLNRAVAVKGARR